MQKAEMTETYFNKDTRIEDVISDPVFGDYGRLIFPVNAGYYQGNTLGNLSMTWYNHIDSDKTVEIVNYMKSQALSGNRIFYDIYTEEEKAKDPTKRNTGLFFFKGYPGQKFAICNAGGGMAWHIWNRGIWRRTILSPCRDSYHPVYRTFYGNQT